MQKFQIFPLNAMIWYLWFNIEKVRARRYLRYFTIFHRRRTPVFASLYTNSKKLFISVSFYSFPKALRDNTFWKSELLSWMKSTNRFWHSSMSLSTVHHERCALVVSQGLSYKHAPFQSHRELKLAAYSIHITLSFHKFSRTDYSARRRRRRGNGNKQKNDTKQCITTSGWHGLLCLGPGRRKELLYIISDQFGPGSAGSLFAGLTGKWLGLWFVSCSLSFPYATNISAHSG